MQLKAWLLAIRIINIICAAMMIGFEIWFIIALIGQDHGFFSIFIRMFAPIFIILLALMILSAEFKYQKVVEHFKFLQFVPGLAFFNLFMASIMAFQFSTIGDWEPIMVSCLFVAEAIVLFIMYCLKPAGTEGLLTSD